VLQQAADEEALQKQQNVEADEVTAQQKKKAEVIAAIKKKAATGKITAQQPAEGTNNKENQGLSTPAVAKTDDSVDTFYEEEAANLNVSLLSTDMDEQQAGANAASRSNNSQGAVVGPGA
jgi:hypothetical protein